MKKALEKMSIGIAVSFGGSCKKDFKIVTVRTAGSRATVTTWGSTTRDGTIYIPNHILRRMLESSGLLVIEANQTSGDKQKRSESYED
jgi:hypothetical protein